MAKEQAADEEQSEFNSAIATLQRIDKIKQVLDSAHLSEDYLMQFRCLKAFFLELVSVMDDKDDDIQQKKFLEVRRKYYQLKTAMQQGKKQVPMEVIDSFLLWEIELRNTEQKYGLNVLKKSDPRFAMAGR